MVSVFLVVAAIAVFCAGLVLPYEAFAAGNYDLLKEELPLAFLAWLISAVLFGSAAVVDSVKSSMRRMIDKIEELEAKTS